MRQPLIPNGAQVRVWIALPYETTNIRGELNGNYKGEGPLSVLRSDKTLSIIPAERVAWVEEIKGR